MRFLYADAVRRPVHRYGRPDAVLEYRNGATALREDRPDHFDDSSRAVERDLNMGNIHLEHVLPQTPVSDPEDPTWLREFFKLDSEPDIEIASEIERYIELVQRSDLDEEEERLKDNISSSSRRDSSTILGTSSCSVTPIISGRVIGHSPRR